MPVEVCNPLGFLPEQPKNIPKEVVPTLAVAAGLAVKCPSPCCSSQIT